MEQAEDTSEKSEEKAGISAKSNDNLMRTMYEIPSEYEIDTNSDKTVIVNNKNYRIMPASVLSDEKQLLDDSACHTNNNTEIKENVINNAIDKILVMDKLDNQSNDSNRISNDSESSGEVQVKNNIPNVSDANYKLLCDILDSNPEVLHRWITEKATKEDLNKMGLVSDRSKPLSLTPNTSTIATDLFQPWLASSPVKLPTTSTSLAALPTSGIGREHWQHLDEGDLFMELIRDIANELDIDVLCHKILVNVGLLTHADRGSLFLAKGDHTDRYLVPKLFDVTQDTLLEDALRKARAEEIRIPFGVGIAGSVAQTKEIINLKDAYNDPRFNDAIDVRTGYKTNLMLSMPICNYEGDVIGVAQIINKTNGSEEFTNRDVDVFRRYLTFCGIGIQNAQLFEMSVLEYQRNQILLNLARSIFAEQNNLECLVTKIMTEARQLLKCERCAVFLLDLNCCEASHLERIVERPGNTIQQHQALGRRQSHNVNVDDILEQQESRSHFTMIFELGASNDSAEVSRPSLDELKQSTLAQIAHYVATSGQILNISDVSAWLKVDQANGQPDLARNILCMPIYNGQKNVIGVAQLINKDNGNQFSDCDISIFEAFAIFCGLGIHNTQMYESACKLMAKQKVALECLSYHATAANEDTLRLVKDKIPSADTYNLYNFTFIDFGLSDDDTCRATVRMFLQCNLVQQFHVPYDVLCRWILSVRKNYRPVKYHNWRHAFNVAQTMFAMLKTGKMERFMTDLEILGLLVACLCHDLDHRGTNNAFQTKIESPLAILYSTSTMEHHHFDQCVMILNSESNNIFQALSPQDYRSVMKIVETAILSTDLAMYFKKRNNFLELIENGEFDWQSEDKKELLCGMMMTACDVSAIAKPWEIQHRVAKLVADEFFDQGDLEKLQLNQQPVAMMDRERKDELPQMQVGFIDVICLPLYRVLSDTFPWIRPLYNGTLENRQHWQDLAEKVEMGLTWIDHDTIDNPVEEFTGSSDVKDIEFTVTTLNCTHISDSTEKFPSTMELTRRRFDSLRKTKVLPRTMRSRLSKSLYSSSNLSTSGGGKGGESNATAASDQQKSASQQTVKASSHSGSESNVTKKHKGKQRSKICTIL